MDGPAKAPGDADGVFARLLANDIPTITASIGSAAYTERFPYRARHRARGGRYGKAPAFPAQPYRSASTTWPGGRARVLAASRHHGPLGFFDRRALTLTGVASLAAYQTALRSITYVNTSENPSTSGRTVSFVVNDGHDPSAATRGLSVTAINDPPVMATSSGSAAYTEDGLPVTVDPALTASDVDSAMLASATIVISAGYVSGQDTLLFTSQLGITGSWDAVTGTLTLSGAATLTDYQTAAADGDVREQQPEPGHGRSHADLRGS